MKKEIFDLIQHLNALSKTDLEIVMKAVADIKATLPKRPPISEEHKKRLRKKGEKREKDAERYFEVVKQFPQFLPGYVTIEKLIDFRATNAQMFDIQTRHLDPIIDIIETVEDLTGTMELDTYSFFYKKAEQAVEEGDPDAVEAVRQFRAVNPNATGAVTRQRKKKNTPPPNKVA